MAQAGAISAELPDLTEEQIRRLDVPGPRYTSYPTVPEWSDGFGPEAYAAVLAEAGRAAAEPLSLYVHIPFCREMCLYCGCNVVVASEAQVADRYLDTVDRELDLVAARLGRRRRLSRVHWGGGTPTFLTESQMRRLWAAIGDRFTVEAGAEVALEADPAVTSAGQLDALRELGFNRLSMGVQDFDPEVQEAVRRRQRFDDTRALMEHARRVGFGSINLDLIYGLPQQSEATWARTLERLVELRPDRVAVFSFAYVPAVRPHQRKLDPAALPGAAAKYALRRLAHRVLVTSGYWPVGMDHFALPHDELARAQRARALWRDFQGYTTRTAADTVAVGITGIGDVGAAFAQNVRSRTAYREAIDAGRFATERGMVLSADDRCRRQLITQLMCNFWVDLAAYPEGSFADERRELARLEDEGLLAMSGDELTLTPLGRVFVRNVAMVFDAYLGRRREGQRPTYSRTV